MNIEHRAPRQAQSLRDCPGRLDRRPDQPAAASGEPPVTLVDFACMTAVLNTGERSLEAVFARFGIDQDIWARIAGHWTQAIVGDAEIGAQFSMLLQQEMNRLLNANRAGI